MDIIDLLIIIPARGGSKGLPRKNARILKDIPLLEWTAQAVKAANLENTFCLLSSDDEEIAAIGKKAGLKVPFIRPSHLGTDEMLAEDVIFHAVDWLETEERLSPKALMWLQPTSPFRSPSTIQKSITILSNPQVDAVIGVKPLHRNLGMLYYCNDQGALNPLDKEIAPVKRRQEIKVMYTPNGALYLIRTDALKKEKTIYPKSLYGIVLDQIESIEIDDPTDWSIVEAVASAGQTWRDRN